MKSKVVQLERTPDKPHNKGKRGVHDQEDSMSVFRKRSSNLSITHKSPNHMSYS